MSQTIVLNEFLIKSLHEEILEEEEVKEQQFFKDNFEDYLHYSEYTKNLNYEDGEDFKDIIKELKNSFEMFELSYEAIDDDDNLYLTIDFIEEEISNCHIQYNTDTKAFEILTFLEDKDIPKPLKEIQEKCITSFKKLFDTIKQKMIGYARITIDGDEFSFSPKNINIISEVFEKQFNILKQLFEEIVIIRDDEVVKLPNRKTNKNNKNVTFN
ncbi:MAG: hypothetical protein ACRC4M_02665 [Mycoplasma sp.]